MKKNMKYSFFVFSILVFCLVLGIYLGFRYTRNNEDVIDYNNVTADDNENVNVDDKVSPVSTKAYDIELIYQDIYTKCGHVIESKNTVYGTTLDKLKETEQTKQQKEGNKYEIVEESNEKLVYKRQIDQNCPNHFLVKLEEGTVYIYNIVDESAMTVYRKINVDSDTLNPEMLEELNLGIKANSKEELNLIIEDIES